jgi:hypothetical protein
MIVIETSVDWSDVKEELHRLESMPNFRARSTLDAILLEQFVMTQKDTHVITGSLLSSGKQSSSVKGKTWYGEISYGGASAGVNGAVSYAIYERQRGGTHDFFRSTKTAAPKWVKALLAVLEP